MSSRRRDLVNNTKRGPGNPQDNVQDLGVQRVPGQDAVAVQSEGRSWRLSFRALRLHHSHVSGGLATSATCGLCQQGLEGALAKIEVQPAKVDEVAEDRRADEKGDPTSSPSAWPYSDH